LYVGRTENETEKFAVTRTDESMKTNGIFNVLLYPNPAASKATLQIHGNAKDVGVSITDMAGKVIWQINENNHSQISLPAEKLAAGVYTVTVKSGLDRKILKFVKE
jgi:Secretion system C-terminal sorting domain